MVDEPRRVSFQCCINDEVVVYPEHITADALAVVVLLPVVREHGMDLLSGVLDHHLASLDLPLAEQAHPMDPAAVDSHCLLGILSKVPEPHCHG